MKPLPVYSLVVAAAVASGFAGYHVQRWERLSNNTPLPPVAALEEQTGAVKVQGMPRPDFSLTDVNGNLRRIEEWDGRVIALNFWATWCPPCLKEIPEFIQLQKKYADRGLQFIGIALQRPEEVLGFMQEHAMNYPVLAGEMEVVELSRAYGNAIGALPYTVIIDRDGKIAFVKHGQLSGQVAEKVISRLL